MSFSCDSRSCIAVILRRKEIRWRVFLAGVWKVGGIRDDINISKQMVGGYERRGNLQ
jgi:hypothetical protein